MYFLLFQFLNKGSRCCKITNKQTNTTQLISQILFSGPRLLHDREIDLYDGTRLLRWDRYQTLKEQLHLSDQELQERYTHACTQVITHIWVNCTKGDHTWKCDSVFFFVFF